ncbi:hypothetical protein AMECASPLE_021515 [Ameca splendens]|uniref:Uncharacterized protein n=1 Tax=Ameca splendens TaxID=208324 RepID=A0ABV0XSF7_9TELE
MSGDGDSHRIRLFLCQIDNIVVVLETLWPQDASLTLTMRFGGCSPVFPSSSFCGIQDTYGSRLNQDALSPPAIAGLVAFN